MLQFYTGRYQPYLPICHFDKWLGKLSALFDKENICFIKKTKRVFSDLAYDIESFYNIIKIFVYLISFIN